MRPPFVDECLIPIAIVALVIAAIFCAGVVVAPAWNRFAILHNCYVVHRGGNIPEHHCDN